MSSSKAKRHATIICLFLKAGLQTHGSPTKSTGSLHNPLSVSFSWQAPESAEFKIVLLAPNKAQNG
ncbi:hypothetical protein Vi05172_g7363 [Venturia inaequalis]|nr:hypothetical protein Vi05172_g7363 [Venturia inaequalis]